MAPPRLSDWRPWAGHALLRDGWDAAAHFAFFDAGPWGTAHQHDDALNVTLVAHGRQLLADGGRYRYTVRDPLVQHLRGTGGHNALLIDGRGQRPGPKRGRAVVAARFARCGDHDVVLAHFDGGWRALRGRVRHDRALCLVHGWGLIVIDRVRSDRPRRVAAHWRFGPELTAVADGLDAVSSGEGVGQLRIMPLIAGAALDWSLDIVRGRGGAEPLGWYSPRYNEIAAASVALYEANVGRDALFGWAMPTGAGPVGRLPVVVTAYDGAGVVVGLPDGREVRLFIG